MHLHVNYLVGYVLVCVCVWYIEGVMSLSSAITKSPRLPFTVRCVAPVNHKSRDQHSMMLHGQQLTISQIYDCTVLLASPIHGGKLYIHL